MPDRHRHDEFIWALIFSLIINLLFVFVLVAQRKSKKPAWFQPFVVSIAANHTAFPRESSARVRMIAVSTPARGKATATIPELLPLKTGDDPVLPPVESAETRAFRPVTPTERDGEETALSLLAAEREIANTAPTGESADGLSIWGDKIAGDHYTAPEYLGGEKPPYPKRAERNGWEGTVLLSLSINANGEVEKVGIAKTSGYDLLDHQARESVGAWRFKPARRNGIAIAVTVRQPIIFRPTPPENIQ